MAFIDLIALDKERIKLQLASLSLRPYWNYLQQVPLH